jgi:hypothetical protein
MTQILRAVVIFMDNPRGWPGKKRRSDLRGNEYAADSRRQLFANAASAASRVGSYREWACSPLGVGQRWPVIAAQGAAHRDWGTAAELALLR